MSLCFLVSVLQEEEGGVCPEVVHAEARRQCSRLTGSQRKSPADWARHAPPPLLARITTRRNPDRVEGRQRDPAVRSLNAGDRPPGAGRALLPWLQMLLKRFGWFSWDFSPGWTTCWLCGLTSSSCTDLFSSWSNLMWGKKSADIVTKLSGPMISGC